MTDKKSRHNDFSDSQYSSMYENTVFVEFVNTFFSSYLITFQELSGKMLEESKSDNIYLTIRIILANISTFIKLMDELVGNLSYSYAKTQRKFQGEIRGALNTNKYVQEIAKNNIPRNYPCTTKQKSYNTPENLYVVYILQEIRNWLTDFEKVIYNIPFQNKDKSYELKEIEIYKRKISVYINKPYFLPCRDAISSIRRRYGASYPKEQIQLIQRRISTGKVRNSHIYQKVIVWFSKYNQKRTLVDISMDTVNVLRYTSDTFADRIFELWNLFWIKETFIKECKCELVESNGITISPNECKFVLKTFKGDIIRIYYQKGNGLYWDDEFEQKWKYIDDHGESGLRGIPDISVEYISENNLLIMIDVKNRFKEKRRSSEEIYKMIGYYSNFRERLANKYSTTMQRRAALLVRNDVKAFTEDLEEQGGTHHLKVLSVTPGENEELNINQFKILCNYILNSTGIEGTISSILSNYDNRDIVNDSVAEEGEDAESVVYKVSQNNHRVIEALFNEQSLQDKLELHMLELEKNFLPHIWNEMSSDVKKILAMAECLFSGMVECENVDCAPICLEFCRAVEVQINELVIKPFRKNYDVDLLARRNHFYRKMLEERDMTLGECMFFFEKCNHRQYPLLELKNFIAGVIKNSDRFLNEGVEILRGINEQIRRRSAHTDILGYGELVLARQKILGIGFERIFYLLLDKR